MVDINSLPPIATLPGIESRFKAFAGPGAGKTTWLIKHIKRVLKGSNKLGLTGKIACITYTNVAAEQLLNRLDIDKAQIEVTTIHSFLYNNIIKPFDHLIYKDDNGHDLFNIYELHGHEEHIPHADRIRRWLTTIEQANQKRSNHYGYLNSKGNKKSLTKYLSNLDYCIDKENAIVLYSKGHIDVAVPTARGELWTYKKKYWSDGIMHHEDVLYFAYYIICKSPRVLEFVRSRYPYLFIDEFQDTTALQTAILKKIAEGNTVIGVIGDLAQSIYKFAGAVRSDFENLSIQNMVSYKLEQNFRSTQSIITFLNLLRPDIEQQGFAGTLQGERVTVLIGNFKDCYKWSLENISSQTIAIAAAHSDLDAIRSAYIANGADLLTQMYGEDSNSQRAKFIHSLLIGYRWLERKNNKEAIRVIAKQIKALNPKASTFLVQKLTIYIIEELKAEATRQMNVHDYYMLVISRLSSCQLKCSSKLSIGAAKTFYQSYDLNQLLAFVKVDTQSEDTIRTIHSTKGAEFDCVLVYLPSASSLQSFVFDAKNRLNASSDDARIYYVGFSRAKKKLLIAIPVCNTIIAQKILDWGLEVKTVPAH